jgi:GNAT superfamily N-acetyltransferase
MTDLRVGEQVPVPLRVAEVSDIPRLEHVIQVSYRGGLSSVPWKNDDLVKVPRTTEAELNELVDSAEATILVAEIAKTSGKEIAGCVLVEKHVNDAHIGLVTVAPEYQNLGLGKHLVKAAEGHAASRFNCRLAKMFVLSGRTELIDWYKRLGYRETGELVPFPEQDFQSESGQTSMHMVVLSKSIK